MWAWSDELRALRSIERALALKMPLELGSGRQELLERAELPLFWAAVVLVFFSFHIGR